MKLQILLLTAFLLMGLSGAAAQTPAPKTISAGVVNGTAISLPAPQYPAAARALGAEGSVKVQVVIDEEGNITSASAVSGHPLLRGTAETAARQAKFKPTQLSGVPVKVSGVIVYFFNLPVEESIPEEEIEFIGIAASLRIMTRLNSDPRLSTVANIFFDVFGKESSIQDLPEEFAEIKELTHATSARRTEILADLDVKFRANLTGDQIWQFGVGEVLGDLMAESLKRAALQESDPNYYRVNLLKLRDQMISAPKGFPNDLRLKINELAAYGEMANLDNPEVLNEIESKLDVIEGVVLGSGDEN